MTIYTFECPIFIKLQLQKPIFVKPFLKDVEPTHSSELSKCYLRIKSDRQETIDLAFASCIWCFDISPQEGKLFLRGHQSVIWELFIDTSKLVTKSFLENHTGRSFSPFPALGTGFDLLSIVEKVSSCKLAGKLTVQSNSKNLRILHPDLLVSMKFCLFFPLIWANVPLNSLLSYSFCVCVRCHKTFE